MNLFNQPQPENLCGWLMIATKKLAPTAQERVWKEILAHYVESVAAHQAEGLPELEAQKKALAELGDVYVARKGLRKTYLLEKEARYLSWILDRNRKGEHILSLWLLIPLLISEHSNPMRLAMEFTSIFLVPIILFFISKGKSAHTTIWLGLISDWVGCFGFLFWLNASLLHLVNPFPHWRGIAVWVVILCFCRDLFAKVRLSSKLGGNLQQFLPNKSSRA